MEYVYQLIAAVVGTIIGVGILFFGIYLYEHRSGRYLIFRGGS